ncbi:hypothetical protein RD110_07935 [Rhodoferax koreense]|uniref:Uncharacterized protein n=1 Tax=Rhodoferax koreensis TaxID=1842727 RepID=A0A1P8JTR3_9BURK|nr:hypothetical protein RD110_07935 [Rhodoferax koreense]
MGQSVTAPTRTVGASGHTMATRKIGRDAETGLFKPVKEAEKDKKGSVVETIKIPAKKPPAKKTK